MRNKFAALLKLRLLGRSWLVLSGFALTIVACVPSGTRGFSGIGAPAQSVSSRDTVSTPLEIFNDGGSGLNAIRGVIQTPAELDRLWVVLRRDKSEPPPSVDFSKDMLIVAGMGWEPVAGYRIRISTVRDAARLLEIMVDIAISTADCTRAGYATIDHPTVMVRVPKSQSTPVFQDRVHHSC